MNSCQPQILMPGVRVFVTLTEFAVCIFRLQLTIPVMNYFNSLRLRLNTFRPRQNGSHFADDIFNCIFLNENVWIPIKISMKFVPKGPVNNIPALVQIIAWHRPGYKPLSEPMMVSLTTQICITRPQWVNGQYFEDNFLNIFLHVNCCIFIQISQTFVL